MEKLIRVKDQTLIMVYVKGATVHMGDTRGRDTQPVHPVRLDDFYIGQTQVTQALWEAVTGDRPSHFHGDDLPVESVTLSECHGMIQALNALTGLRFRLPTEAEWEYAAKGGQLTHGYLFSGSDNIDDVAWYDQVDRPQKVAQKMPNELGLYDMSGNICEWCEDIYAPYPADPQCNPTGAQTGSYHLARGGGWYRGGHMCRVYDRGNYRPEYASNAVGLRLVMDVPQGDAK